MRFICGFVAALGLNSVVAEQSWAQTKDTPFQRLSNWFNKGKTDSPPKVEPRPMNSRPTTAKQHSQQPTVTKEPYETRGLVVEETPASPTTDATSRSLTPATPVSRSTTGQAKPISFAPNVVNTPTPTGRPLAATNANSQKISRIIGQACPQARNVRVTMGAERELNVELDVRSMEDCNALAGAVFGIRELDAYKINLKFKVPQQ